MSPVGPHFRAGAGAVILDTRGRALVFERSDVRNAWQFPQGGLEPGESPEAAAWREVQEETGLTREDLTLIGRFPEPLVYELPVPTRHDKTGLGQVQYWFFFRAHSETPPVRLEPGGEFRASQWRALEDVVASVVSFRKPVYERLESFARTARLI